MIDKYALFKSMKTVTFNTLATNILENPKDFDFRIPVGKYRQKFRGNRRIFHHWTGEEV